MIFDPSYLYEHVSTSPLMNRIRELESAQYDYQGKTMHGSLIFKSRTSSHTKIIDWDGQVTEIIGEK
jgi:hypothetical protein